MRNVLLAAAASGSLLVGACQTAQLDSGIQSTLAAICPIADQAHAAFTLVAMRTDKVERYVTSERQAYAAISVACSNPGAVNSQNILVFAAGAYAAWEMAGVI